MTFEVPETNRLETFLRLDSVWPRGLRPEVSRALHGAYRQGLVGAFCDQDEVPDWARKIARHEDARFREEITPYRLSERIDKRITGKGKGKRAVYWNLALKLDPRCFAGKQNYPNCTAASLNWEGMDLLSGIQVLGLRQPVEFTAPYGTALHYGARGHSGGGMALSTAARASVQLGTQTRSTYLDGKYDLRDEDDDEYWGNVWGRSGPPSDLVAVTDDNPVQDVGYFDGDLDMAMDVLWAGGFLHTGSTYTAGGNGDPISPLGRVGAHAQTCIGYDDTEEFREYYQKQTGKLLDEAVLIFGQTWGAGWIRVDNWPPFWGPYPQGSFVLKASDGWALIGSDAYGYGAVKGFAPADLDWMMV